MDKAEKTSVQLSIPMSRVVRGYEIRRLPMGKYLEATEILRTLPEDAMRACFPGKTAMDALAALKALKTDEIPGLLMQLAAVLPAQGMRLLSVLTGIDQEQLMTDERIGLDGAAEMIEAAMEINRVENFISAARRIAGSIRAATRSDGCKG